MNEKPKERKIKLCITCMDKRCYPCMFKGRQSNTCFVYYNPLTANEQKQTLRCKECLRGEIKNERRIRKNRKSRS